MPGSVGQRMCVHRLCWKQDPLPLRTCGDLAPLPSEILASEGFSLPVKWKPPPGINMCNVGSGAAGLAQILVRSPTSAASEFPGEISESPGSCPHALQNSESVGPEYSILIFPKLSDSEGQLCWGVIGMTYPQARVLVLSLTGGSPLVPQGPSLEPSASMDYPELPLCDQRLLEATVKNNDIVQPCNFPFKETNQESERPNRFPRITQQVQGLTRLQTRETGL